MTIGTVLLQPQKIARAAGQEPIPALVEDLLVLAAGVAEDPAGYEPALAALGQAMVELSARAMAHARNGSAAAIVHLRGWVTPILGQVDTLAQALAGAKDAEAALTALLQLVGQLGALVASLTAPQIGHHVQLLLAVLQQDLGLSAAYIEGEIWTTLDDMILRLDRLPAGGDAAAAAKTQQVAALLRRVRRRLRGLFALPELNPDRVAAELLRLLQRSGLAAILQQVACVGQDLGQGAAAGEALLRLVGDGAGQPTPAPRSAGPNALDAARPLPIRSDAPPGLAGLPLPVSSAAPAHAPASATGLAGAPPAEAAPAAGSERYCWYATWLLHDKDLALFGTGDLDKPDQVVSKIKSDPAPIFGYLRQRLAAETLAAVNAYTSGKPPDELVLTLVVDLNRLIQGPSIYDEDRFRGVTLSEHTRGKLDERPSGDDLVELNRKLLEDAFGDALDRLNRHWYQEVADYVVDELVLKSINWPGKRVYVDGTRTHLMLDDIPLHAGADVDWFKAPMFDPDGQTEGRMHYGYKHIGPDAMEIITWVTALIVDAVNLVWHLTEIQPRHQISPIWFATYDLGQGLTSGIAGKPYAGLGFTGANWLEALIGAPMFVTAFTAIQGRHPNADFAPGFKYWLVKWVLDTMNFTAPSAGMWRDIFLETLTLWNFRGPGDYPSSLDAAPDENRKHMDAIVDAFVGLFTGILAGAVPRKDYGLKGMPGSVVAIWLAGGFGISIVGGALGGLVGEIIAWAEDFGLWGKTMILQWPKVWLQFIFALYAGQEGDTNDGKYNASGADFKGYPSKSPTPSPYWLPYDAGSSYFVDQGNQGMFSHNYLANPDTIQVYAYDLALDNGDVVLASRSGTVDAFRESVDDNGGDDWNYIRIRHDVDESGKLLSQNLDDATHTSKDATHLAHDRDAGGAVVITFAEYGHGKKNGVSDAFKLWSTPVATNNIVGTRVKRGQPIMLADHTGNSLHNHLHMHVLAGMLPTGKDANEPTNWTPKGYSIPFVYQDVDSDNGVCKANKWYTSSNERKLA